MSPQLAALFAQHKTAFMAAGAAGVVGLALLQKKKGTAAKAPAAASSIPGTIPAAAVVPATGSTYDSTSFDTYNALQPELERILQQQAASTSNSGGITSAPAPIASTLFSPTYSGNYLRYSDGWVGEAETDGSQLWFTPSEWQTAIAKNGGAEPKYDQLTVPVTPGVPYSVQGNLASAAAAAKAKATS